MSSYSASCCTIPPVVQHGYGKKGTYETVSGLKTYVTGPPSARNAILVIYDIFGFSDQMLQGADILALSDKGNPYRVFVPDFFDGKAADVSWYPPTTEEQQTALNNFFTHIGNPTKAVARVPRIITAIKKSSSSIENVFGLGLCWGGKVMVLCSGKDSGFKAIAQAHPAMINPDDATKVEVPICMLASKDEDPAAVLAFSTKLRVANHIQTFSDQIHGWMAARADLGDANVCEKYRQGYQAVLEFFGQHLSRSPKSTERSYLIALWSLSSSTVGAKLIDFVRAIPQKAKKDGASYVFASHAGATRPPFPGHPSRAAGLNVNTVLEFASLDDASYWRSEDPVHKQMVELVKQDAYKDPVVTLFVEDDHNICAPGEVGDINWSGQWNK